jgi:hypothetical protein
MLTMFTHRFASDRDVIRAMQDLYSMPDHGRHIPDMGYVSSIWYAFYSKHYTSPYENTTGLPRGLWEDAGRRRSSSALSRETNAYRNQLPNNMLSNASDFGNYGPGLPSPYFWRGETDVTVGPNMVPVYQQPTQRVLWDPNGADQARKPSKAESKSKDGLEYQPKTYPKRHDGVTAFKEDWRSKPPAEEAIEDISNDEAIADSSSNISSQGAKSVKVCLPNETGSLRSRSVSPDFGDISHSEKAQKDSPELKETGSPGADRAQRGGHQDSEPEIVAGDDDETLSGYRIAKANEQLSVPVEGLQPVAVSKQAQPVDIPKKGLTSYSKTTSELTDATESFDVTTVIRHKPARSPLPVEWMSNSEQPPSKLQSRLGALTGALQQEALGRQHDTRVVEGADAAVEPDPPKAVEALSRKSKAKSACSKSGKARRSKEKTSNGTSTSSSSANLTEAQAQGESQASNHRPISRASSGRPESAVDRTTQSPTRPTKKRKKYTKSQKKPKQASSAEPSGASARKKETEGTHNQIAKGSVESPPMENPRSDQSVDGKESHPHSTPESAEFGDCTQGESIVEKHDDREGLGSGDTDGGSVFREKDRSPQKPPEKSGHTDKTESLQGQVSTNPDVAFESPAENDLSMCSPEANLFLNQKFTIDKVKRDSALATPPATKVSADMRHRQPSAMHATTNDARIALPLLPHNWKKSGWASVASRGLRSKSGDPFISVNNESQEGNWLRDIAVKTPQRPSSEPASHQTSPTPSPGKKTDHQGAKNTLNGAARAFEPSSILTSPAVSVASTLSAKAIAFHTKPSLPGQMGPVEQRLITPAEQVVDPTTVAQPSAPTKEKKRVGPAPDRGEDGGQKARAKSPGTLSAATMSKKAAAQAAAAVSIASKLEDEQEFPTLAAAAAMPQRRPSAVVKSLALPAGACSKTAPTTAPKVLTSTSTAPAAPAPKSPVTSPDKIKLGHTGNSSVPAAEKQDPSVSAEKAKADEDQWTTVSSGKKSGGKRSGNNSNRNASSNSSGSATGQGGRAGGQGSRSGKALPVGEERKGG